MDISSLNVDPAELEKFKLQAARWWDPESDARPLHDLNPVRLAFVQQYAELDGKEALDVGCGGGLLSEAMAKQGANVTAIDLSEPLLKVARLHLHETPGLSVDYQQISAEQLAEQRPESFEVLTCLEMLEHVPDPAAVVAACAQLVKPGGLVFFSTINRTAKAFAMAIVGAEYVLNLLPRGTHEYSKFIRPSELAGAARKAGLELVDLKGLKYDPFSRYAEIERDVSVNYIACFRKSHVE